MNDQLKMLSPQNLLDIRNAISSLGLESGLTPSDEQVGLIVAQYGLGAVLASLSARQAKD